MVKLVCLFLKLRISSKILTENFIRSCDWTGNTRKQKTTFSASLLKLHSQKFLTISNFLLPLIGSSFFLQAKPFFVLHVSNRRHVAWTRTTTKIQESLGFINKIAKLKLIVQVFFLRHDSWKKSDFFDKYYFDWSTYVLYDSW